MNKRTKLSLLTLTTLTALGAVAATSLAKNQSFRALLAEDCGHANVVHHDAVEATFTSNGSAEYWCCCECHASFKDAGLTQRFENTSGNPTDRGDGRFIAAVGRNLAENITFSGTVSEEPLPNNAYATVYEQSGKQGQFLFNDTFSIAGYSRVAFMVKGGVWFILRNSWSTAYGPDSWKNFELVKNEDGTWNIYSGDVGGSLSLKYSNISGTTLKEVTGFGGEASTYYTTNIRYIKDAPKTDLVAASSVAGYTVEDMDAPLDYEQVTLGTTTYNNDNQGKTFLADLDITNYKEVTFGFKTANRKFCSYPTWGMDLAIDTWYVCTYTLKANAKYDVTVSTLNGSTVHTYTEDASSFKSGLLYCNYGGDYDMQWYSTEVRGTLLPSLINSAIESATVSSEAAPHASYKTVYTRTGGSGIIDSAVDISGYSFVSFAFKSTAKWFTLDGWGSASFEPAVWKQFIMVKNDEGTWDIYGATVGSALQQKVTGRTGTDFKTVFNLAIDSDECFMTDVKVFKAPESLTTVVVGNSSVSSYSKVNYVAPAGFETVTLATSGPSNTGRYFLTNFAISSYSSVQFAFLTKNRKFASDGWATAVAMNTWWYVTVTNNGDGTYDSVVKAADGTEKFSYTGVDSFAHALKDYTYDGDQPVTEWYSTEVRGTLNS